MTLYERVGCIHIHSRYSDGSAEPSRIVQFASRAGLDYIVLTDHNTYQPQHEGWYGSTLLLVGEELHNPERPHANHYLALNAGADMLAHVDNTQGLIDAVRAGGGLGFIAHPFEHSGEMANEPEINWLDWDAAGYTGLELWNYMSEFKSYVTSPIMALLYAFWPKLAMTGPYPETLAQWDALQAQRPVVAIAGVDAHAGVYHLGPLARQVFSYEHLFRSLTTHVLLPAPWSGDAAADGQMLYAALGGGKAFLAYDGLAAAKGFAFNAQQGDKTYSLGDEFLAHGPVRLSVHSPAPARLRLLLNGFCLAESQGVELDYTAHAPGVYRVEAYRRYAGKWRNWVLTNAIRVCTEPRVASRARVRGREVVRE